MPANSQGSGWAFGTLASVRAIRVVCNRERGAVVEVVAFGECMVEVGLTGPTRAAIGFAGDTFNVTVYLRRQGLSAAYGTAVGEGDPFSDGIMRLMAEEGVDASLVRRAPGRIPGLYAFDRDAAGERRFFYWRAESPARDYFALADMAAVEAAVGAAKLIYLSGITQAIVGEQGRETLIRLLTQARAAGAAVAYDPNYRPQLWAGREQALAATESVVPLCTYILVEVADLEGIYGDAGAEKPAQWAGPEREVVLRDRNHDVVLHAGGATIKVRHDPPVRPLDTTGAGDSFNAGYLAARLRGEDLRHAVLCARRLSNIVVQHIGAIIPRTSMPTAIAAP
jgi:2-dehydro-3-deoxygluconokinase